MWLTQFNCWIFNIFGKLYTANNISRFITCCSKLNHLKHPLLLTNAFTK